MASGSMITGQHCKWPCSPCSDQRFRSSSWDAIAVSYYYLFNNQSVYIGFGLIVVQLVSVKFLVRVLLIDGLLCVGIQCVVVCGCEAESRERYTVYSIDWPLTVMTGVPVNGSFLLNMSYTL